MKKLSILLGAALLSAAAVFAAAPVVKNVRVEVLFDQPEKFTDASDSYMGSDRGREAILELIKEYILERAPQKLVEGQTLTITFTDIDLAGDFEPWRGVGFGDVRIVKDIYPPRLNFSYKLVDAAGVVVREGGEKLRDNSFMMTVGLFSMQDTLRYEKTLFDNWLSDQDWGAKMVSASP